MAVIAMSRATRSSFLQRLVQRDANWPGKTDPGRATSLQRACNETATRRATSRQRVGQLEAVRFGRKSFAGIGFSRSTPDAGSDVVRSVRIALVVRPLLECE